MVVLLILIPSTCVQWAKRVQRGSGGGEDCESQDNNRLSRVARPQIKLFLRASKGQYDNNFGKSIEAEIAASFQPKHLNDVVVVDELLRSLLHPNLSCSYGEHVLPRWGGPPRAVDKNTIIIIIIVENLEDKRQDVWQDER